MNEQYECTRCGRRTPIDYCAKGPCPMIPVKKRRLPIRIVKKLALGLAVIAIVPCVGIAAAYVNSHWTEWRYAVIAALDCAPATDLRVETPDGRTVLLYECNTANDVYPED